MDVPFTGGQFSVIGSWISRFKTKDLSLLICLFIYFSKIRGPQNAYYKHRHFLARNSTQNSSNLPTREELPVSMFRPYTETRKSSRMSVNFWYITRSLSPERGGLFICMWLRSSGMRLNALRPTRVKGFNLKKGTWVCSDLPVNFCHNIQCHIPKTCKLHRPVNEIV